MAVVQGTKADIRLINVLIAEVLADSIWFRVSLGPDPVTGEITNIWLPDDSRIAITPSVPANWPPVAGDVWTVKGSGQLAWVVDKGDGTLFFVTVPNIKNKTTPISTNQALAQFGTTLQLVSRVPV
jgi:hypothetical protein